MCMRLHSFRVVLLSGLFLCTLLPPAAPAGQIVALVDEHGNKVYVNTAGTSTRVDWIMRGLRPDSTTSTNRTPDEINRLVEQTASRHQVDPGLVRAMVRVESGYDTQALSSKGAMGLMQLIPATAQRFRVANPFDPKQNLEGGVNYLKYLLDLFGGDLQLSLAAYNAGEHSVQRGGGVPAISETRNYVRKVTNLYQADVPVVARLTSQESPKAPIVRYVDKDGVIHFSNVE
jgi:hypothetical protein